MIMGVLGLKLNQVFNIRHIYNIRRNVGWGVLLEFSQTIRLAKTSNIRRTPTFDSENCRLLTSITLTLVFAPPNGIIILAKFTSLAKDEITLKWHFRFITDCIGNRCFVPNIRGNLNWILFVSELYGASHLEASLAIGRKQPGKTILLKQIHQNNLHLHKILLKKQSNFFGFRSREQIVS